MLWIQPAGCMDGLHPNFMYIMEPNPIRYTVILQHLGIPGIILHASTAVRISGYGITKWGSGLSPRTVRRLLKELADGEGINFSASFDMAAGGFLDVFVRINWNDKMISVGELSQWLWREYPTQFWAPWSSASEPVMFADFLVKSHQEAELISNQIRETPFVISTTTLLSFSAAKFPYFTELKLNEILDDAGV